MGSNSILFVHFPSCANTKYSCIYLYNVQGYKETQWTPLPRLQRPDVQKMVKLCDARIQAVASGGVWLGVAVGVGEDELCAATCG